MTAAAKAAVEAAVCAAWAGKTGGVVDRGISGPASAYNREAWL
jgi:hypothetical protein